jgi:hypothetical protein
MLLLPAKKVFSMLTLDMPLTHILQVGLQAVQQLCALFHDGEVSSKQGVCRQGAAASGHTLVD